MNILNVSRYMKAKYMLTTNLRQREPSLFQTSRLINKPYETDNSIHILRNNLQAEVNNRSKSDLRFYVYAGLFNLPTLKTSTIKQITEEITVVKYKMWIIVQIY